MGPAYWEEIGWRSYALIGEASMSLRLGVLRQREVLCKEFPDVFEPGLGTLQGFKATIQVDKEASPVFCKARAVPYAISCSKRE